MQFQGNARFDKQQSQHKFVPGDEVWSSPPAQEARFPDSREFRGKVFMALHVSSCH